MSFTWARTRPALLRRLLPLLLGAVVAGACAGMPIAGSAVTDPSSAPEVARSPSDRADASTPRAEDDDAAGGPTVTQAPSALPLPLPPPAPTATPAATPSPSPSPVPEAFEVNLYGRGDFVRQYTFDWCVGASVQMMLNMIREPNETSRSRQEDIWNLARRHSAATSYRGGANPVGWAAALEELGAGEYELVNIRGYEDAIEAAARSIRATGRPVGLVMWTGRHAWVMSGFTSVGDPRAHVDFEITGIRVLDPLYPHGSRLWGPSPKPNALLTPDELAEQFVRRIRNRPDYAVPGSYVLILPV